MEVHDPSPGVTEDLDLDVAGLGQIALDEEGGRAEGRLSPALGRGIRLLEGGRIRHFHHADAAAARRGLQHDGIADLSGHPACLLRGADGPLAPRHHGHAGPLHLAPRAHLVSHLLDDSPGRSDPDETRLLAGLGEAPVLGEKAVAGMNGLGAALAGGRQDALPVEIALPRGGGADEHGLVGIGDVGPAGVSLGVDGDGSDPEGAAGADDAAGDLAAIGDEDALEHAQAGCVCSIFTTSTAPTRQPSAPCSQRALRVTAPPPPSNRYFTMRCRPSFTNATAR